MNPITYLNPRGDFTLARASRFPTIYFPLMNQGGIMSSITPHLAGDCKIDQEHFLLAPASSETLHESRATRNFWVLMDGMHPWSVSGQSAAQIAQRGTDAEESTSLTAGLLWQKIARQHQSTGLVAETLSFVPAGRARVEIMQVTLRNEGKAAVRLTPVAAVPLYGRSADNIRDHRHVTSLLHRAVVEPHGLTLTQTMTFDERGHQPGDCTYRVWAGDEQGHGPEGCIPRVEDYVGSGSYDWPDALLQPGTAWRPAGTACQGGEMVAALRFAAVILQPGQTAHYQVCLAIQDDPSAYLTPQAVSEALEQTKAWWQQAGGMTITMGDGRFAPWAAWTAVQPTMRRICGCSFLPHHDYGRGGRGWRDLWQDSLALLLSQPEGVGDDLADYCQGVRIDGTNATIIGAKKGEFKADRNGIPRVWMDHGFWPILTVAQYLDETGDDRLLLEERPYFCDTLAFRGEGPQRQESDQPHTGTVLEHLLVQAITAFYDVGGHGHIRLRGADWNDALDMARDKGESVAFTAAYALALMHLARMLRRLDGDVAVLRPLLDLSEQPFGQPGSMQQALMAYCRAASVQTEKAAVPAGKLAKRLDAMADFICGHIRQTEWVGDGAGQHWFNSYYDNDGQQVEGMKAGNVYMMLTGQVFCLMAGVADDAQARAIASAADKYLCCPARGGYCLNTDFHEVLMNMGRMFGFAYGHKENGAVFCHMAVMYANALYTAGLAREGWKVLELLFETCCDFSKSRILPGIPEYFDDRGVGMYPYLTGAASWLMLTLRTKVFGVTGDNGDLVLRPMLMKTQFDGAGKACISCLFGGVPLTVEIRNPKRLDYGEYAVSAVTLDGQIAGCRMAKEMLHPGAQIVVTLDKKG